MTRIAYGRTVHYMALRFDVGELGKPRKDPQTGWLKADGFITRVGVFKYRRADGSELLEYRSPEEVFHADSLASFEHVPLTNDHPSDGLLTADNTKEFQRGTILTPRADGKRVRSQVIVTDADAIKDIQSGKTQLSCGYVCDLIDEPGVTPEGERYDAVQRNIRGNHVALVKAGRAGPDVRLRADARLDSAFEVVQDSLHEAIRIESPGELKMATKFKVDGVDHEMSETAAQAVQKALSDRDTALTAAKADAVAAKTDADKVRVDADKLKADLEKAKAELKDAPAKALAHAKARADLESKATSILGGEKFDGLSDADIKAQVIAQEMPKLNLDGKSADYVDAMFDRVLLDHAEKKNEGEAIPTTDSRDPVAAARAKYQKRLDELQPH